MLLLGTCLTLVMDLVYMNDCACLYGDSEDDFYDLYEQIPSLFHF
jgi:hypothetical protein